MLSEPSLMELPLGPLGPFFAQKVDSLPADWRLQTLPVPPLRSTQPAPHLHARKLRRFEVEGGLLGGEIFGFSEGMRIA